MRPAPAAILAAALVATTLAAVPNAPPDGATWVRPGFAEARTLDVIDIDGDGADEVVVGARGLAAYDTEGLATGAPRWWRGWNHDPDDVLDGGHNTWVTGTATRDVTGDGILDLWVTTSDTDAYLVDGATGDDVWWNPETGAGLSQGFAVFDGPDGSPLLFPTGGKDAISGLTGEVAWAAQGLTKNPKQAAGGDLDPRPGGEVAVAISPPGAGTNPTTIPGALTSPTVFAYGADGAELWRYIPVKPVETLAAADVNGDGRDEVIVGTYQGIVEALGVGGVPLWSVPTGLGAIDRIEVADLDGDGRDDLVVGNTGGNGGAIGQWAVYGLSGLTGATLWSHDLGVPVTSITVADVSGSASPEIVVGAGTQFRLGGNEGRVVGLSVGPGRASRSWQVATNKAVLSTAVIEVGGATRVLAGEAEAALHTIDPVAGERVATLHLGGYVSRVASGDLDGDGAAEVASGDDAGQVIVTDASGSRRWSRRLDIGNDGSVSNLAFGDLDGDGRDELFAMGARLYTTGPRAVVVVFDHTGGVVWTRELAAGSSTVRLHDLDGDGGLEVVLGEGGLTCGVHVLEGVDGTSRWRTGITDCAAVSLDVGDADGDGQVDILYAELNFMDEPWIARLAADGSVVWSRGILDSTRFVRAVDGGFVHAGASSGTAGHVTRRRLVDGEIEWRTVLPKEGDRSGEVRSAVVLPDIDRDGRRDLAVATDQSDLRVVSGATGAARWRVLFEPIETYFSQQHQAGPVALLDGPAPTLVAGQWSIGRARGSAFVVGADGAVARTVPLPDRVTGIAVVRGADGARSAAVGAGLGVYGVAD